MNVRRWLASVGSGPFAVSRESSVENNILSEEEFHRVIARERRRTERSRSPFLLVLLDMNDEAPSKAMKEKLTELLEGLASSMRETDVAGWYKGDSVLGAMFTEIEFKDRATIVTTMMARLSDILRNHLDMEQFNQVSISFHVYPEEWDQDGRKRPASTVLYPDVSKKAQSKRIPGAFKRTMDVLGSLVGLVLLSPVFLAIAVILKLTDKGPILFRQQRIGQFGKPFSFLKFRSMRVGNDAGIHREYVTKLIAGKAERNHSGGNSEGVFKLTKDPRITPVGAFLRKTSLDELPQLINVLRGEMSLVGPRPPVPYEVEAYDLWHRRRLLEVKPGITGLWQVSGRSRVTFDDMVRLDLQYARAWTPWMDVKILLRTPRAVVIGDGAH